MRVARFIINLIMNTSLPIKGNLRVSRGSVPFAQLFGGSDGTNLPTDGRCERQGLDSWVGKITCRK